MSAQVAQTFFAIGLNYWGCGTSIAAAKRELKRAGWHRRPSESKKPIILLALSCSRDQVEVIEGLELRISWPEGVTAIKWTEEL